VGAAIFVLEAVNRLRLSRALVSRHRDAIAVYVGVGAAIVGIRRLAVFLGGRTLVVRIEDAVAVAVCGRWRWRCLHSASDCRLSGTTGDESATEGTQQQSGPVQSSRKSHRLKTLHS